MIFTLALNPCIDRTVFVSDFHVNGANAVLASQEDVAGKGINVASAAKALGLESICAAPEFQQNGWKLREFLDGQGILHQLFPTPGLLRTNIKILNEADGSYTELNEAGNALHPDCLKQLLQAVEQFASKVTAIALCGSLPRQTSPEIYEKIILRLKSTQVPVLLDTSGEALCLGVKALPQLIKPNLEEFSALCGIRFESRLQIAQEALRWHRKGIPYVCVSLGAEGALLAAEETVWYSPPLHLQIKGVQGAGDAMIAGFCMALEEKLPPPEMLRMAVAAASASLERKGSLLCTKEGFEQMCHRVGIEKLESA